MEATLIGLYEGTTLVEMVESESASVAWDAARRTVRYWTKLANKSGASTWGRLAGREAFICGPFRAVREINEGSK